MDLDEKVRPRLKNEYMNFLILFFFFFARIGRSDLTKKLEKVGPFECDELEKHCRVSAKCYPTKVPALYTMNGNLFVKETMCKVASVDKSNSKSLKS